MSKEYKSAAELLGLIVLPDKIEPPADDIRARRKDYIRQLDQQVAKLDKITRGELRADEAFKGRETKFFVPTKDGYVYRVRYAKLPFELTDGEPNLGIPVASIKDMKSKILAIKGMVEERHPDTERALTKIKATYEEMRKPKSKDSQEKSTTADAPKAETSSTKTSRASASKAT